MDRYENTAQRRVAMSDREINKDFASPVDASNSPAREDDATILRRWRERDARLKAAHIEFQRRLAEGSAPENLRAILWDPGIPEDLRFEVMLMELADCDRRAARIPPLDVFLARSAEGRRVMRAQGSRIPPPAERRAWMEWRSGHGPRPDGKPDDTRS